MSKRPNRFEEEMIEDEQSHDGFEGENYSFTAHVHGKRFTISAGDGSQESSGWPMLPSHDGTSNLSRVEVARSAHYG